MVGLGIDIGTSAIKVALWDGANCQELARASSPASVELPIDVPFPGAAEQSPDSWWEHVMAAIQKLPQEARGRVKTIGIAYQMHGLVLTDEHGSPKRPAIIWCDGRAVGMGDELRAQFGDEYCAESLLNAPGNFTLSKLRWVAHNEPEMLAPGTQLMLPGDFVALRLTGIAGSSDSGISETIGWDFPLGAPVRDRYFYGLTPVVSPSLSVLGPLLAEVAEQLGLPPDAVVSYRAGDQPNNALSVGVNAPGETAATGGTSGVLYALSDDAAPGILEGVNRFLHPGGKIGTLMCINGAGSAYAWFRRMFAPGTPYGELNNRIASAPHNPDLMFYPFGNGPERILNQRSFAGFVGVDFARHGVAEMGRAVLEGIGFAFGLGAAQMAAAGSPVRSVRAAHANLFLSPLFSQLLANQLGVEITTVNADGAVGAAQAGLVGAGLQTQITVPAAVNRYHPDGPALKNFEKWREGLLRNDSQA